jgi:tetratricopeptide (TPR) repeat protein
MAHRDRPRPRWSRRARRPRLQGLRAGLGAVALVLLLPGLARADYLLLEDGRRIDGKILEETAGAVTIKTNFGTLTFDKDEIVEIKREKTRDEIYAERLAACETAEDFYRLGLWCEEEKLRRRAEELYEKAIAIDPDHAGARGKLGFVRYEGEWMTPAERDRRAAQRFAEEMRAKGLVELDGRWVTPEDKARLERGLVEVDGRWMTRDEALREQGFGEYGGEMMPAERALALTTADGFAAGTPAPVNRHVGAQAVVIGVLAEEQMAQIAAGAAKTRAWFDQAFGSKPDLRLFGGRLPELYVFGPEQDAHYPHAIAWTVERSNYVPEGWDEAVRRTLGFTWIDPIPISAARQGPRGPTDLAGHCYHNMGHLMAGRLLYDGKLLPPWYEEGVAAVAEMRTHGANRVFCRSSIHAYEGSRSNVDRPEMDEAMMRDGSWRHALAKALEVGHVRPFDKLAQLSFSELDTLDVAQSMAIVEWLESQPGALARFHRALRGHAPSPPARLHLDGNRRQAAYDAAFRAAADMGFRQADGAWRAWFRSR